jgi:hypothetical protein
MGNYTHFLVYKKIVQFISIFYYPVDSLKVPESLRFSSLKYGSLKVHIDCQLPQICKQYHKSLKLLNGYNFVCNFFKSQTQIKLRKIYCPR